MTQFGPDRTEERLRVQTRLASIVIAVSMLTWMGGSMLGGALGAPVRFAFLLDLACLGALFWALVVLLRVWRARRELEN